MSTSSPFCTSCNSVSGTSEISHAVCVLTDSSSAGLKPSARNLPSISLTIARVFAASVSAWLRSRDVAPWLSYICLTRTRFFDARSTLERLCRYCEYSVVISADSKRMIFPDDATAGEMVATTRAGAMAEMSTVPSRATVVVICSKPVDPAAYRIVLPSWETVAFLGDPRKSALASPFS